ncbi:MAG: hypothetical protein JNK14_03805 [Chitinophagaceae bacterium]|nr:hypothetical protein [Chitinophagaceae bacterium]
MANDVKLFSEFQPVTAKAWKEVAIKDLKGADFDKKLVWKTEEGILVQPFYTEEDLPAVSFTKDDHGKKGWLNYIGVNTSDPAAANEFIRRMMAFDISGVLLNIEDPEKIDFHILLNDVNPEKIEISFQLPKPSPSLFRNYFDFIVSKGIELSAIHGFVQTDVLETWSVTGQDPDIESLAEQMKVTAQAEHFKGLMLSSHSFVNAGSGIVQELAFTLSKVTDTIELLEKTGLEREKIIDQLALHLAIGGNYFFEIAKLRAIRTVLTAILERYSVPVPEVPVLSSNAAWSKSLYDPNVNMLRNTTEAMSAILGGCDAILIHPHDSAYNDPDEFSHRVALNISNLLKEESYFDKVADPAAGSYYIETITSGVAEKTLQLFNEFEANGGYVESFVEGVIQEKIAELREKKENETALRRQVYVGTNKYPDLQERTPSIGKVLDDTAAFDFPLLRPQRATQRFEEMKQRTRHEFELTGKLPKVYLACFGNLAMRKARASFVAEFFGTAGFEIMGEFFFDDIKKGAEESVKSDADIVVLCSSDAEYETDGKLFAEGFKQCGSDKKLLVAGYPAAITDILRQAGVDDFIHVKTNVIEFITALQSELFAVPAKA